MMRWRPLFALASLAGLLLPPAVFAQDDAGVGGPAFKEGDVISIDKIEQIKPYLPPEFWANRDFFFYEGMKLEDWLWTDSPSPLCAYNSKYGQP